MFLLGGLIEMSLTLVIKGDQKKNVLAPIDINFDAKKNLCLAVAKKLYLKIQISSFYKVCAKKCTCSGLYILFFIDTINTNSNILF